MTATVLQLSDTHLGASSTGRPHGLDPDARLGAVLDAWRSTGRRADAVVLTGDLADDGTSAGCARLAAALRPLDAEVLAVPGNHDAPAAVAEVFGRRSSVEVGGWRLVGVDTSLAGRVEGRLDAEAVLAHLDSLDDRPTALALHHPPRGPSSHPWFQLDGADALLAGLRRRSQVRLVLSGHLHQAFDLADGSLGLLGAPSTLYAIRHLGERFVDDPAGPTGGRVVDLHDDGSWQADLLVA